MLLIRVPFPSACVFWARISAGPPSLSATPIAAGVWSGLCRYCCVPRARPTPTNLHIETASFSEDDPFPGFDLDNETRAAGVLSGPKSVHTHKYFFFLSVSALKMTAPVGKNCQVPGKQGRRLDASLCLDPCPSGRPR